MIGRTVIKNVRLCAWITVCLEMPLKKCSNKILHIETEELNKLKLKDNQIEIQCTHIIPGRMVEIYAVEIIKLQSLQLVINYFRCGSFAVFTRPKFASDPYFFTRNSTVYDILSHTGFVEISMCSIQVTVSWLQRCYYGIQKKVWFPRKNHTFLYLIKITA